ncbi:MAG: hypothetical protein GY777_23350 [Candidatus Brocadiaceae bacterium]|nr:hypothetical protein [Candidatus Brocadiaceae bacterium]
MKQHDTINIEEILSYLSIKKNYYEKILRRTLSLEETIKTNNLKELNLIIAEKTNYTKDIKRLDRLNTKYQEEIISNHENLMSDKRFNSLKKQLQTIIIKITNHDQKCKILLNSSMNDTKDKIDNLNKKRVARKTMRTQETLLPSFVDVLS